MATFNALVSCVTSPNERFRPSMTSTRTSVFFFTKANLYCYTNFLLMKHADALEPKSVWASIIMGLLHLIVISTKKHSAEFENNLGTFALYDPSRSNLVVLIEIGHVHFLTLLVGAW